MTKALKIISGLLVLCVTGPIWYYLLHSILIAINADRLLWFLYWIYVPVALLGSAISIAVDKAADKAAENSK